MNLGAWAAAHKVQLGVGGAAAVAGYALYRRAHATSSTAATAAAATPVAGSGGTISGSYPYSSSQLDQYNQLAGAISNLNDQVQSLTTANAGTAVAALAPAAGGGIAPATAFNPYPVGAVVAPGEHIVQALPVGTQGYVDVTNEGGLYTTGGLSVPGSGYTGAPGNFTAALNGNTVYEYTPSGVKPFALAGVR